MHTNETKDKFIELRLKGVSLADIAKKIGVSKTTLVDWNQRYADELRALRSAELESLHARILQSYDDDFDQLRRMQSRLEARIKIDDFQFFQNGDQLVRSYQIVRNQVRQLRKDIESFGEITSDSKKPMPAQSKSETSNVKSAESLQSEISNSQSGEPLKSEISNLKSSDPAATPPSTTSVDKNLTARPDSESGFLDQNLTIS